MTGTSSSSSLRICFLDIAFYFVEEFFLCLLFVGIEQQALLISFIRQFIHINANKKANLRSLRYEFPDSKIPGSSKIPYKCIKEMHFLILENAFYFFKKGIFFFIGEKFVPIIKRLSEYLLDL